jgi:AraC family transcriptional activator of pobA
VGDIKEYSDVNRDDNQLHFRIGRTEDIWAEQVGRPDAPHRHGYYTVILIKDAEGTHTIDYTNYKMVPQSLFFVSPGQVHQIIESRKPQGYVLLFSTEFLLNNGIEICFLNELHLFHDYGETPPFSLSSAQADRLSQYAEEMIELSNSSMPHREQAVSSFLKLFLLYAHSWFIAEAPLSSTRNSGSDMLRHFKEMVEQNYSSWHGTSLYAQELGISPDHLNRTVKQLIGKTAKEYVQSRLIVEAQRLLTFSTLSAKEISYELGFTEPGNFSSFFKKRVGKSPSQFKKSLNIGIS